MDIVGGSFLSSFFQVLLDRMATPVFQNLFPKRKRDDDQLLRKLKRKLLGIQAVLDDAENKQNRNPAAKGWLAELHDAVYKADDLLDEINTEALRLKVETEYQSSNNTPVSISSPNTPQISNEFLDEIMPKIEEMLEILDDHATQIHLLGLKEGESQRKPSRLPSTSLVEKTTVGKDDDKKKTIQMLLSVSDGVNTEENFTVISIVGLGGIGKTTLAQLVYNDERVKTHFDTKAWVCISEAYDVVRTTRTLLAELNISCSDSLDNFNSLQIQLQQGLADKRFLLVLDDVWNKNYDDWQILTRPFNGGKKGSKIIVTTRDEGIARMIRNGPMYHLHLMSDEDCWSLFEKHAFGNGDIIANSEFKMIGEEIVKKCKGLPLAVKTLGGLLRSKSTAEEWNDILKSDLWDLPENQSGILPALRLSYNDLPSVLKRCFTYCAVFPKDYEFGKDEVILLWIANDLLKCSRNNKRIEDIGDELFRELRSRSLFQKSSCENEKFSMHDMVNDLAKFGAAKDSVNLDGFVEHDTLEGVNHKLAGVRHFSYLRGIHDTFEKFKHLNEAKCLRTFLPKCGKNSYVPHMSPKFLHDILPMFRFLRVLSLSGYGICELPSSFGNLKQLRFLDLSFTPITKLPDWVCSFYNLQILLLQGCHNLKELPEDMGKLINLRHLDASDTPLAKMAPGMGQLRNLQFLSHFIASKDTRIRELGKLCNLWGKLTISGLETVTDHCSDALMAKMKDKERIKELTLRWSGETDDSQAVREVLDRLRPHSNIERVTIEGYGATRFPNWIGDSSFGCLKSLRLENCGNCVRLPSLGQLPSLELLEIVGMRQVSVVGEEFYGDCWIIKPFQSLKVLSIEKMEELNEWHVPTEGGVFSGLEELCITGCPKLMGEFPKQLPSLRKLKVWGCLSLVTPDGGLTIFRSQAEVTQQRLSSLTYLWISGMPNLKELSSDDLKNLTSLQRLTITACRNLDSFPINALLPYGLKLLRFEACENLRLQPSSSSSSFCLSHIPTEELDIVTSLKDTDISLGLLPDLSNIRIFGCRNLQFLSIPRGCSTLASLRSLYISFCYNLMSFPEGGLPAPTLNELTVVNCGKLKSLPERMHTLLPSLRSLYVEDCQEIECFPEGGLPILLETLSIRNCKKLWSSRREWGLHKLLYLTYLEIGGLPVFSSLFPEEDWMPSSLQKFLVSNNHNLKTLNYKGLQHLTSLQSLAFGSCRKLQSLPEEGLPASLSRLEIWKCPLLKPRLQWQKGEDWHKVAHIPTILIDKELIP